MPTPTIETRTIYQIPLNERHGTPRDLFAIWFGCNIMMLTIVTGALAPTIYHLGLLSSIAAIILGNAVGGIFMALHSAQGAELGVPQMVQTRGQFGTFGANAVILLVVFMYVGFVASNFVLGGESLHLLAGGLSTHAYIIILCLISLAAAIYGHDLIHAYSKALSWIAGAALLACFVWVLLQHPVTATVLAQGRLTTNGFLGAVSAGALWQIAYAPYVSDYSRYLPPTADAQSFWKSEAFWASYAGCVAGSIFPMILGALLVIIAGTSSLIPAFAATLGPLCLFVVPAFSFGIASASAMNLYCAVLSTITVLQTFLPGWHGRPSHRIALTILLALLSLGLATVAAANFMENYTNFILLLLYVLVPWTAINLVDFYLIKHGSYDVDAFLQHRGGKYGRYNIPALVCYVAGILIQIPFVSNPLYTGPIAALLGGADISWIVGLAVVSPMYWAMMRQRNYPRIAS